MRQVRYKKTNSRCFPSGVGSSNKTVSSYSSTFYFAHWGEWWLSVQILPHIYSEQGSPGLKSIIPEVSISPLEFYCRSSYCRLALSQKLVYPHCKLCLSFSICWELFSGQEYSLPWCSFAVENVCSFVFSVQDALSVAHISLYYLFPVYVFCYLLNQSGWQFQLYCGIVDFSSIWAVSFCLWHSPFMSDAISFQKLFFDTSIVSEASLWPYDQHLYNAYFCSPFCHICVFIIEPMLYGI